MGVKLQEPHPLITSVIPEMVTKELRVTGSVDTDDLTPTAGKRIRVLGVFVSLTVGSALTSTLRATVAFGTDHTTDTTKILTSFRSDKGDDARAVWLQGINVAGAIDEVVRLTNVTYSNGSVVSRAVIYYREE